MRRGGRESLFKDAGSRDSKVAIDLYCCAEDYFDGDERLMDKRRIQSTYIENVEVEKLFSQLFQGLEIKHAYQKWLSLECLAGPFHGARPLTLDLIVQGLQRVIVYKHAQSRG